MLYQCCRGLAGARSLEIHFFGVLRDRFPDLLPLYERIYPHPAASYGGVRSGGPHATGRRIRDLCCQYGISDRMPRPIIPGDKRALNKRIVRVLARNGQCYWMELDNAVGQRVWAYRKAAWAIEDLPALPVRPGGQDVGLIYRQMGRKGLEGVENVGPRLAGVIEDLLKDWADSSV